jgi:hypothetical protein
MDDVARDYDWTFIRGRIADQEGLMKRRSFITAVSAGAATLLLPERLFAEGRHDFRPVQVAYRGGQPVPYPSALRSLVKTLKLRTSIDADEDRLDLPILAPELFRYPFLYMAGRSGFDPFTDQEIDRLAMFLKAGGTLVIDDASGIESSPFDASVKREVVKLFPDAPMQTLGLDHTIFRSFYLLDRIGGRVLVKDAVMGVTVGDRSPILYCQNDLGGAWATDLYDRPMQECVPGGDRQREMACRLGVNIIMYALCINYKKDRIHVETILNRRRLKQP